MQNGEQIVVGGDTKASPIVLLVMEKPFLAREDVGKGRYCTKLWLKLIALSVDQSYVRVFGSSPASLPPVIGPCDYVSFLLSSS